MNNPILSVVVPVYKTEQYICECVESILGQTFADFELVLVDDGSPDNCGMICDVYAQKDTRVRVIHQENGGASKARNRGIEACTGKYIAFIDSDDVVEKKFFEKAIESIETSGADMYISGLCMETWEQGKIVSSHMYTITEQHEYSIRELLENLNVSYPQICICGPCCKLYRATIIETYNLKFCESLEHGEDTFFNLDFFEKSKNVLFSNEVFYHYRRTNKDSLFSKFHRDTYEVHQKVYGKMRELMDKVGCERCAKDRFDGLCFAMLLGGIHEYFRFSEETTKEQRRAQIEKVAKDPNVANMRFKKVYGLKNKLVYILLKLNLLCIVELVFELHYWTKKWARE